MPIVTQLPNSIVASTNLSATLGFVSNIQQSVTSSSDASYIDAQRAYLDWSVNLTFLNLSASQLVNPNAKQIIKVKAGYNAISGLNPDLPTIKGEIYNDSTLIATQTFNVTHNAIPGIYEFNFIGYQLIGDIPISNVSNLQLKFTCTPGYSYDEATWFGAQIYAVEIYWETVNMQQLYPNQITSGTNYTGTLASINDNFPKIDTTGIKLKDLAIKDFSLNLDFSDISNLSTTLPQILEVSTFAEGSIKEEPPICTITVKDLNTTVAGTGTLYLWTSIGYYNVLNWVSNTSNGANVNLEVTGRSGMDEQLWVSSGIPVLSGVRWTVIQEDGHNRAVSTKATSGTLSTKPSVTITVSQPPTLLLTPEGNALKITVVP